jgi:non-homologous end joining protein Ku
MRSMPRSIWSGSISFGLVSVPVRLYSAVSEHKLRFNLVHEKDSSPIGYDKVCEKGGKPVPDDEIVKAWARIAGPRRRTRCSSGRWNAPSSRASQSS